MHQENACVSKGLELKAALSLGGLAPAECFVQLKIEN
jgi:hypothetical protein